MKKLNFLIILFFLLSTLSCSKEAAPSPKVESKSCDVYDPTPKSNATWTIMVYMNGDNDLESAAIQDLNEMEQVDLSNTSINVIVMLDRTDGYDNSNGDWKNTRIYEIKYDSATYNNNIISRNIKSSEFGLNENCNNVELNMGHKDTLSKFVDFGKTHYQADKYALIIWNHGSGWKSGSSSSTSTSLFKAVSLDETNSYDIIYTSELGEALSGKGLEIIGFDLCYGAMFEVAYELKNHANYMIGSEEEEPADGWEYNIWLESFITSEPYTTEKLIHSIIEGYKTKYSFQSKMGLAAIKLSEMDNLFSKINSFSSALYNAITVDNTKRDVIKNILMSAQSYNKAGQFSDKNIDIYDMADKILNETDIADTEANQLKTAVSNAIVEKWSHSSVPGSNGLAIHLVPVDIIGNRSGNHSELYNKNYTGSYNLNFVRNSTWPMNTADNTGLLYRLFYETF